MRKLFAKAQDPISCETHALGAVAALGGGLLYLLRGVWTDAAIPAVAAALCFCLSMAALYAASAIYHYYPGHCRQRRSEAGAAENGPQYDLCADCRQLHALLRGAAAPAQGNTILPDPLGRGPGGVLAKMLWINAPRMLSTAVYLIMGWSVVFVAKDFTWLWGSPA